MESRRYSTDLSDDEGRCIHPHLPGHTGRERPRLHGLRAILDAVFYVLKSGCPWRLLSREFPPWKTIYDWFRRWRIDGTCEHLNTELRERLRWRLGRDPNPSAGIVDSQPARTTGVGGNERGFDPAKKVESRKCHLLVDTEGLVLEAKVHSVKIPDEDGIRLLLNPARDRLPRLSHLWVDAGYQGRGRRWAEEVLGVSVEVVRKPRKPLPEEVAKVWAREWGKEVDWQRLMPPRGFRVLPRRWVVERTFEWISHNRRMAKDYERLCATGEAFVYVAMTRLMVRRLPVRRSFQTVSLEEVFSEVRVVKEGRDPLKGPRPLYRAP
jgi:putative transposase